jgi:hypothetical protein
MKEGSRLLGLSIALVLSVALTLLFAERFGQPTTIEHKHIHAG